MSPVMTTDLTFPDRPDVTGWFTDGPNPGLRHGQVNAGAAPPRGIPLRRPRRPGRHSERDKRRTREMTTSPAQGIARLALQMTTKLRRSDIFTGSLHQGNLAGKIFPGLCGRSRGPLPQALHLACTWNVRAPRGAVSPNGGGRPRSPRRRSGGVKLEAARAAGRRGGREQPRQSRVVPVLPDGSGAVSETGRYTRETGCVTPLDEVPALNPVDSGWLATRTRPS